MTLDVIGITEGQLETQCYGETISTCTQIQTHQFKKCENN